MINDCLIFKLSVSQKMVRMSFPPPLPLPPPLTFSFTINMFESEKKVMLFVHFQRKFNFNFLKPSRLGEREVTRGKGKEIKKGRLP